MPCGRTGRGRSRSWACPRARQAVVGTTCPGAPRIEMRLSGSTSPSGASTLVAARSSTLMRPCASIWIHELDILTRSWGSKRQVPAQGHQTRESQKRPTCPQKVTHPFWLAHQKRWAAWRALALAALAGRGQHARRVGVGGRPGRGAGGAIRARTSCWCWWTTWATATSAGTVTISPRWSRRAPGILFEQFYTQSTCTRAVILMTGRYNIRNGMQDSVVHSAEPAACRSAVPLDEAAVGGLLDRRDRQVAPGHAPGGLPAAAAGFDYHYGIYTGGGSHTGHFPSRRLHGPQRDGGGHLAGYNLWENGRSRRQLRLDAPTHCTGQGGRVHGQARRRGRRQALLRLSRVPGRARSHRGAPRGPARERAAASRRSRARRRRARARLCARARALSSLAAV